MKHTTKILSLLLAGAFALGCFAGCNDIPPAESPSESVSESEALPELSNEELFAVKNRIQSHQETTRFIINYMPKEYYESVVTLWQDGTIKTLYETIMSDVESESYCSASVANQLQQGMLINEVFDLIGQPHFNAMHYPLDGAYLPYFEYDFCAMHILRDGRILLTRYIPLFHESYNKD